MDFAVIDLIAGVADNLQCIWCGMFMDVNSIAMHFHEIHPETVEVPNCRLCLHVSSPSFNILTFYTIIIGV
jgi:hypothetical protein